MTTRLPRVHGSCKHPFRVYCELTQISVQFLYCLEGWLSHPNDFAASFGNTSTIFFANDCSCILEPYFRDAPTISIPCLPEVSILESVVWRSSRTQDSRFLWCPIDISDLLPPPADTCGETVSYLSGDDDEA
ncbi:hypothetical protein NPIL_363431 [Nephila pilipes]|uniref:Uncharacterized protein n=1 Tax=Nephila pilipes TaxID=299642 RepID=A0A8X6UGM5_NEPPI|nr:hypothetical protein NPIL_363431 [Nephila pilipes]